jgi:hypothetical protein
MYGFSRLENTLLNYINLQQKDALKAKMWQIFYG